MLARDRIRILTIALLVLSVCVAVFVGLAAINQRTLNRTQEVRYHSHLLAEELRDSSEELTRAARTYVVTGDPKYENLYWHLLAVRSGQQPRPDGRTASLRQLMEEMGFTAQELHKLEEAEDNSNELVNTERVAMNAVKGRFKDKNGNFTRIGHPNFAFARRIMHDDKYQYDKETIMRPIREVDQMLDQRTGKTVQSYIHRGDFLLEAIAFFMLLVVITSVALGAAVMRQRKEEEDRLKMIEELAEAVRLRDEFLSIVSHELRTPVTPLTLKIQILLRLLSKATTQEVSRHKIGDLMSGISRDLTRIHRLIEELHEASLMSFGQLPLRVETFDLGLLVQNVLKSFEPILQQHDCQVHFNRAGNITGNWDRAKLEQVFTHLLTNAIKFGRQCPISVEIESIDDSVLVRIQDEGVGISEKDQKRLFERYNRTAPWKEFGGIGLSLYVTKRIVEMHGGNILVESALGKGTTFTVKLPLARSEQKAA